MNSEFTFFWLVLFLLTSLAFITTSLMLVICYTPQKPSEMEIAKSKLNNLLTSCRLKVISWFVSEDYNLEMEYREMSAALMQEINPTRKRLNEIHQEIEDFTNRHWRADAAKVSKFKKQLFDIHNGIKIDYAMDDLHELPVFYQN